MTTCFQIVDRASSNYSRCGRTDKGVSALDQVVSIRVRSNKPKEPLADTTEVKEEIDYVKTLNRCLPDDIRILGWCARMLMVCMACMCARAHVAD